jgi:hypothetical protein
MKIAMKHVFLFGIFGWLLSFTLVAQTGIWQWSVPVHNFSTHPKNPESRAYLWIPGQCEQVKAILVAQHNIPNKNTCFIAIFIVYYNKQ